MWLIQIWIASQICNETVIMLYAISNNNKICLARQNCGFKLWKCGEKPFKEIVKEI